MGHSNHGFLLAASLLGASAEARPAITPPTARTISLPGLRYDILRSGPTGGAHPARSDSVTIHYVGTLPDGRVFSTSAQDGVGLSIFPVRLLIPGFSALVQLMRPGDHWRFRIPAYLGYGAAGKVWSPAEPNLKRTIPPNTDLIFDVALVSFAPTPP